jgi:hypothetical protein
MSITFSKIFNSLFRFKDITHELHSYTLNKETIHSHNFNGVTTSDYMHTHVFKGNTEPANNLGKHTHEYTINTTFKNDHQHCIKGETGPAIPLPNGEHYHILKGQTLVCGKYLHEHVYNGRTTSTFDEV